MLTGAEAGVPAPPGVDAGELAQVAEQVAVAAGDLVAGDRAARLRVAATKSSPTDVVTEMDQASERLLRERLAAARPEDGLLGEEFGQRPGPSGITWVVDPIDGTVNYLYGLPAYAVSVAAVAGDPTVPGGWRPIAGCVHHPVLRQTWTAALGQGARWNGDQLVMGSPPELEQALIATGFGYRAERRAEQARILQHVLPLVRDIRRIGCASLDLCLVASGLLDGYYERGLQPWDMAAAALVVQEAGGRLAGLRGAPPGEDMIVAAAEPLIGRLLTELETVA